MSSSFAYSNKTDSTHTIKPVSIGIVSNYAKVVDEPSLVQMSNKTCPLDQGELVSYRCNDIDKVTSTQKVQNPSKVRNGVQYVVKCEEILRTTDAEGKIICDEPVIAYVTIKHQKSGNITAALVEEVFRRVVGAMYKSDGTSRIADLMRNAIVPTTD